MDSNSPLALSYPDRASLFRGWTLHPYNFPASRLTWLPSRLLSPASIPTLVVGPLSERLNGLCELLSRQPLPIRHCRERTGAVACQHES